MSNNNTPYYSDDFYVGDGPIKNKGDTNVHRLGKQHSIFSTIAGVASFTLDIVLNTLLKRR